LRRKLILTAKTLFILSLLVLTMINLSFCTSIDWSPDERLTSHENVDWAPSITATTDGKLWVVWRSDRMGDYEIFYKVFNGSTWSNDTRLTFHSGFDDHPCVMEDNEGNIWVVWESDRSDENQDLFYKIFNGTAWSDPVQLTTHPSGDGYPSIAQDSNGTIWLFWASLRTFPGGEPDPCYNEVFYKTFNGSAWSNPIQLTNDTKRVDVDPSVMAASDGKIWVVWAKKNELYYKVHYGPAWSYDAILVWDPSTNHHPYITQADDGKIWVVWDSDRGADTNIYYKIFDGVLWTTDKKLTTDTMDDDYPSITQDNNGTIWVTWSSSRLLNFDLYYKKTRSRDVAITEVTTQVSHVMRGEIVPIEVTALNLGTENETFEVQCHANSTLAGTETISLAPQQSGNLTIQWNTTEVAGGTYVISATAVAVPGEVKLDDNTLTDGSVQVQIIGDICGVYNGIVKPIPDGAVKIIDFGQVSLHVFTYDPIQYPELPPWDPVWGPACDVDENGAIDVNDLIEVGIHFGET